MAFDLFSRCMTVKTIYKYNCYTLYTVYNPLLQVSYKQPKIGNKLKAGI